MVNCKREYYPQNIDEPKVLYYVEYVQWPDQPETWILFKRNYVAEQEVHPWNFGGGKVDAPNIISMQTKIFLEFLVDSLNRNSHVVPERKE